MLLLREQTEISKKHVRAVFSFRARRESIAKHDDFVYNTISGEENVKINIKKN